MPFKPHTDSRDVRALSKSNASYLGDSAFAPVTADDILHAFAVRSNPIAGEPLMQANSPQEPCFIPEQVPTAQARARHTLFRGLHHGCRYCYRDSD